MKLPNAEIAIVEKPKIYDYVLKDGGPKADPFMRRGFTREDWQELARAFLEHATIHEILKINESEWGTRYIIEGAMVCPDGRVALVRSVWQMDEGGSTRRPRFITGYCIEKPS